MPDEGSINISFTLSADSADEFLRRLVEDDEYRAFLEREPREALAEHGISVSGDAIPETIELPPKEHANWVFKRSATIGAIKPSVPTFGSCLLWGVWMLVASQTTELPPGARDEEEPPAQAQSA